MGADRRALVHQFVRQLEITSKSRGNGHDRFTVLSKTQRTRSLDDDYFDTLLEQRRFKNRFRPPLRNAARNHPTVFYKDGDVVGSSAPELGPENRGRAMLEKLGWTHGTALGAPDNKGILQPIAHTVKKTRAGLK